MPDPTDLQRLAQLRSLLSHALEEAKDPTAMGRQRALILLDGACEYAIGLAIHELSLKLVTQFEKNVTTLMDHLKSKWGAAGRKGVSDLHRARNLAQHSGTVPDSGEMPRWSSDADEFVRDLVSAVFGVELSSVAVAAAVRNQAIRALLEEAEQAGEEGDAQTAVEKTLEAFTAARRQWSTERGAIFRRSPAPMFHEDFTAKDVREAVNSMEDLAEVTPFATDIGEYLWLRSIENDAAQGIQTPLEDAQRAFVFVLDWVLRWEVFSARFVADRRGRWLSGLAPPTTGEGNETPVIVGVEVGRRDRRTLDEPLWLEVGVQIADLPKEDQGMWISSLQYALNESANREDAPNWKRGYVGSSGRVGFPNVESDVGVEELFEYLQETLQAANEEYNRRRVKAEEWRAQVSELVPKYEAALSSIELQGKPMFGSAQSFPPRESGGPYWITVEVINIDPESQHEVWRAFHDQTESVGPSKRFDFDSASGFSFTSDEDPEDVAEIAKTVVSQIAGQQRKASAQADADEGVRTDLEAGLAELIRPSRPGGKAK